MNMTEPRVSMPKTAQTAALKIVLLCDYSSNSAGTIHDHIFGIRDLSCHDVTIVNFRGELPLSVNLQEYDGVIIHYSLVACRDAYISPLTRIAIRNFQGVKIAFVQDDYRFINDTVSALSSMRINGLLGLADADIIDDVYAPDKLPGVRRETVLTGYVPEHLLQYDTPQYEDRPIDIGYRARKLPAWLGSHGQEKWVVADKFLKTADKYNLVYDVSWKESDRIYGDKWLGFVSNCKAMIGAESGSGVCDFTGEIQDKVDAHTSLHPDTSFEKLRDLYFKDEDGRLLMNVISPRCFEAAAMRTLMVMYEGRYSGRLVAGRHYVVLDRDHGNMDEVVAILKAPERAKEIIDNAYREVALNPDNTFASMVEFLDEVIDERYSVIKENGKLKKAALLKGAHGFSVQVTRAVSMFSSVVFRQIELCIPFMVSLLDLCIKPLPRSYSEQFRSRLQYFYRRFIRREMGILVPKPLFGILTELFVKEQRRRVEDVFTYNLIRQHPFRILNVMLATRHLANMVRLTMAADGCEVVVMYDPVQEQLVFRAINLDFPQDCGELNAVQFSELSQALLEGTVSLKGVVWSPVGLDGISHSVPFGGSYEFSSLDWGLEHFPEKVVSFFETELKNLVSQKGAG